MRALLLALVLLAGSCAPARAVTRAGTDLSAAAQGLTRITDAIAPPPGAAPPTPARATAALAFDIARTVLDALVWYRSRNADRGGRDFKPDMGELADASAAAPP